MSYAKFVCTFSWKEILMLSYFSYVKYVDLCATINPSTIKDLEETQLSLELASQSYQWILQEETYYLSK